MKYCHYMWKNYGKEDSPKGDLARDIHADEKWWEDIREGFYWSKYTALIAYLRQQGACQACIDVFEKTWIEYELKDRARRGERLYPPEDLLEARREGKKHPTKY